MIFSDDTEIENQKDLLSSFDSEVEMNDISLKNIDLSSDKILLYGFSTKFTLEIVVLKDITCHSSSKEKLI